ncbi:DUF4144 family protein [Shewanella litorisediminis]|uniref:DUF4144 domain-containing protein n=1 Tax=Shewanella litorisediminis TaxID=1173586 RepID=A0ABX7G4U8_9GAMM|nr:DUF4144 family protein [Shewanella litorisediminis]MCL2917900.1 DUF4144 domain-containing protein [Shewanella litorisediminis]QRH02335.1 DUF4144 domain-containing protein [Shewanella litorisediminis]
MTDRQSPHIHLVWPALLKHQGCDELIPLQSLADWHKFCADSNHLLQYGDSLIDSRFQRFELGEDAHWHSSFPLPADGLNSLIRAHCATLGHCCLSKMHLHSLMDAIDFLNALEG